MAGNRLHLHSMVVHSVVALVLLAAVAFVLASRGVSIGRLGGDLWSVTLLGSLFGVLAFAVPSIVTGIADRNHAYATWHPSHRAKLLLSLALVLVVIGELGALSSGGPLRLRSWTGAAVVIANVAITMALAGYGLRITLGRQSLGRTSYVPDMDRRPPADILDAVAATIADDAKLIDPLEGAGS